MSDDNKPTVETEDVPRPRPAVSTSESVRLPDGRMTTADELIRPPKEEEPKADPEPASEPESEPEPIAAAEPEGEDEAPKSYDEWVKQVRLDDLPEEVRSRLARQRIGREVAKRHEAQRALEEAQAKLQELQTKAEPPPPEPEVKPRPKAEDFDDYSKYEEARDEWLLERATQAREPAPKPPEPKPPEPEPAKPEPAKPQVELPPEYTEMVTSFLSEGEAQMPGFRERVTDPSLTYLDQDVVNHVLYSDHGTEVLNYLAENADEGRKIHGLSGPAKTAELMALDRLAARGLLSPASEPEAPAASPSATPRPKQPSKAPKPIKPIRGGGSEGPARSLAELAETDPEAYRRARMQQLRTRGDPAGWR